MDLNPDDVKSDPVDRLNALLANNRHDDACEFWKQIHPQHPRYIAARLLLAEAVINVNPDFSLSLLQAAIEHTPNSIRILRLLAQVHQMTGNTADLLETYANLFAHRPDAPDIAERYSAMLRELGRQTDAKAVEREHSTLRALAIENLEKWDDQASPIHGPAEQPRELYLSLLEKAVSNWIYGDPYISEGSIREFEPARRELGKDIPAQAHTMIGLRRLRNLRVLAETVLAEGIPGDFLEAGVWRGGACILLRGVLKAWNDGRRRVWVADSFAGLPPPDDRYEKDSLTLFDFHTRPELAVSLEAVRQNFARYDLLDDQVIFVEGLFRDTLPSLASIDLAILRLDGDLYSSTMDTLVNLYDRVVPGGFIIIDDYGVVIDARRAVLDFRAARGITDRLIAIDQDGAFWRKRALSDPSASGISTNKMYLRGNQGC